MIQLCDWVTNGHVDIYIDGLDGVHRGYGVGEKGCY